MHIAASNYLPEPRRILGVDDPGLARHRGGIRVQDQVLQLADVAFGADVPAAVPQGVRRAGRLLRARLLAVTPACPRALPRTFSTACSSSSVRNSLLLSCPGSCVDAGTVLLDDCQ